MYTKLAVNVAVCEYNQNHVCGFKSENSNSLLKAAVLLSIKIVFKNVHSFDVYMHNYLAAFVAQCYLINI